MDGSLNVCSNFCLKLCRLGDALQRKYSYQKRIVIFWNEEEHDIDINDMGNNVFNSILVLIHCTLAVYTGSMTDLNL